MTEREAIDTFGRELMEQVRDRSIQEWCSILDGGMKAPARIRLLQGLQERVGDEAISEFKDVVPRVVDTVLHWMLIMLIESPSTRLYVLDESGAAHYVADASEGLAHELYAPDGWFERFSQHPDTCAQDLER